MKKDKGKKNMKVRVNLDQRKMWSVIIAIRKDIINQIVLNSKKMKKGKQDPLI